MAVGNKINFDEEKNNRAIMKSKTGRFFMVLGVLLILSSLGLLLYNQEEAKRAGESADAALTKVQNAVRENEEASKLEVKPPPPAMPMQPAPLVSVEIDGYGYIGYLSIPQIGIELPIMDDWDYTRLRIAPCRQFGETVDKMIIAGHNYVTHFGSLQLLTEGAAVYFTDMAGERTDYVVDSMGTVGPNGLDTLKASDWNLVLYTCTYDGRRRVMAGCKKI